MNGWLKIKNQHVLLWLPFSINKIVDFNFCGKKINQFLIKYSNTILIELIFIKLRDTKNVFFFFF